MTTVSIREQIISQLDRLSAEQQKQVLDFTIKLTRPRGMSGKELLELMSQIHIDPADLDAMERAIEEDCEGIDLGEWDLPA